MNHPFASIEGDRVFVTAPGAGQRSAETEDGGAGDASPEPARTVHESLTPAMREVLAKRQQRSPEKAGRKRSRHVR